MQQGRLPFRRGQASSQHLGLLRRRHRSLSFVRSFIVVVVRSFMVFV
jgi:hypothetical protein